MNKQYYYVVMLMLLFTIVKAENVHVPQLQKNSTATVKVKKKKKPSHIIVGKDLSSFYTKFSNRFRKLKIAEIKEILQILQNKELISNTGRKDFEELVSQTSDSNDVIHEIFIYFGAFPLSDEKKQKEGIRTSIAQTFQELVLKKDSKKIDKELLQKDVDAMEKLEEFLNDESNAQKPNSATAPYIPKLSKEQKTTGS